MEIKATKNTIEEHDDFVQFSILRVKKSIFQNDNEGITNNLTDSSFIASDELQLILYICCPW